MRLSKAFICSAGRRTIPASSFSRALASSLIDFRTGAACSSSQSCTWSCRAFSSVDRGSSSPNNFDCNFRSILCRSSRTLSRAHPRRCKNISKGSSDVARSSPFNTNSLLIASSVCCMVVLPASSMSLALSVDILHCIAASALNSARLFVGAAWADSDGMPQSSSRAMSFALSSPTIKSLASTRKSSALNLFGLVSFGRPLRGPLVQTAPVYSLGKASTLSSSLTISSSKA